MIMFKPLTTQAEWEWVKARAHPMQVDDSQGIVAYEDTTGEIGGIVIMDSWTPSGCQTHFAIDNPICIRRGLFREVALHIHVAHNRRYIFGLIPANNKKAHQFDLKMGFKEVARIPEGFDIGVDYIVVRLAKEENRWLPKEFREQELAA
jgi:hypothetical protein|tara:strand:- start:7293 stop:7739 length:447 start_codon:yes stop_codon:yes gene_type:complete